MTRKILLICIAISAISFPLSAALTAPYVGIHGAIGGANYFPFKDNYFNSSSKATSEFSARGMIDLMLGEKIFFYGKLGYGNFDKATMGLGIGWYIFDKRVNAIGSSLTSMLSIISKNTDDDYHRLSGGEFSIFYNRSLFKHLTLRIGGYFGVDGIVSIAKKEKLNGMGIDYGILFGIAI